MLKQMACRALILSVNATQLLDCRVFKHQQPQRHARKKIYLFNVI